MTLPQVLTLMVLITVRGGNVTLCFRLLILGRIIDRAIPGADARRAGAFRRF
ncbi:hypothetical protein [Streptomyces sp. NPDC086777]|uniref:hypothetical protein n=1 Tax=Streptomyces sp. NPDC086777 TaxID=3154866 RepID=UPI00344B8CAC